MPDSHVMPRGGPRARRYRFRPPRHVPACMALARAVAPLYLRWVLGVTRVEIAGEDRARLEALRGERAVLTPNHPTHDPVVMFQLGARLNLQFYWLAAREVFETPVQGWLVSRVGAYSIDRGALDTDSVHMTRTLLTAGRHWLVLFPEGLNHFLHSTVMPFLPGAARLGFAALSDLAERGQSPPLYLVPVALRYRCLADMRPAMRAALDRLDRHLGLSRPPSGMGWSARLDRIADRALSANEEYYGVMPPSGEDLAARLDRLRERVLSRVADSLGVAPPPADKPLRNRVRKLMNEAQRLMQPGSTPASDYERELIERRVRTAARQYRELRRVMEFVAISPNAAAADLTVEDYLDVLCLLEMEVRDKWHGWSPRAVTVRIGEPLNLQEHLADYRADPEAASEAAVFELEHRVRELLNSTANLLTPLPRDM
jgi:1-acyl-sn-glycerol-3-phosphate acyltransferase